MAKSKADRVRIEIENPAPGGHTYTSLAHARRYVKREIAELVGGKLRFFTSSHVATAQWGATPMDVAPLLIDARPGMPVLPPTGEWMRRMGYEVYAS